MAIYTFYARSYKDPSVRVAGTLDTEKMEITGDESESLWATIESARVDVNDEESLLRAFYDGSRLWIREGQPHKTLNITKDGKFSIVDRLLDESSEPSNDSTTESLGEKTIIIKGGPGSGHYGHAGRPGKRGGS